VNAKAQAEAGTEGTEASGSQCPPQGPWGLMLRAVAPLLGSKKWCFYLQEMVIKARNIADL